MSSVCSSHIFWHDKQGKCGFQAIKYFDSSLGALICKFKFLLSGCENLLRWERKTVCVKIRQMCANMPQAHPPTHKAFGQRMQLQRSLCCMPEIRNKEMNKRNFARILISTTLGKVCMEPVAARKLFFVPLKCSFSTNPK